MSLNRIQTSLKKISGSPEKSAKKGEGSLRKHFGKKEDEKITKTEISKELSKLHKVDQDPDTPGDQLPTAKAKLKKRLVLAKTLSGLIVTGTR